MALASNDKNTGVSPLRRAMKPHGSGRDDVQLGLVGGLSGVGTKVEGGGAKG